jgi:hypothetical protein
VCAVSDPRKDGVHVVRQAREIERVGEFDVPRLVDDPTGVIERVKEPVLVELWKANYEVYGARTVEGRPARRDRDRL